MCIIHEYIFKVNLDFIFYNRKIRVFRIYCNIKVIETYQVINGVESLYAYIHDCANLNKSVL